MRSVLAVAMLSLCAVPVFAQTEAEKRRKHVPSVRAASDCIAAVVRRDDRFDWAVATNSFRDAIGRALSPCQQPLTFMISSYDTIYGTGGHAFFAGPYLDDVERAVRTRLAGEIAATRVRLERAQADKDVAEARARDERAAEAARAEAQRVEAENRARAARAERIELLSRSRDLIRAKTLSCIGREGATMLLTDEKADVVAKAAMIFCQSDVDALTRIAVELAEAEFGTSGNRSQMRDAAEAGVREIVTAHIIRSRGDLIGKSLQQGSSAPTGTQRNSPTL